MKKPEVMDELTSGGLHKINPLALNLVYFLIKYLAPVVVAIVLLSGLI
jgi:hypothetical protein